MTRGVLPTPESVAVPDTDPVYSTIADLRTMGEAIARVTNSTDQTLTITVQTALGDDATFSKPNESGDGFVGAADVGGLSVTGFVSPATSSVVLAAGTPTEGGTLDVAWSAKHRGD